MSVITQAVNGPAAFAQRQCESGSELVDFGLERFWGRSGKKAAMPCTVEACQLRHDLWQLGSH